MKENKYSTGFYLVGRDEYWWETYIERLERLFILLPSILVILALVINVEIFPVVCSLCFILPMAVPTAVILGTLGERSSFDQETNCEVVIETGVGFKDFV